MTSTDARLGDQLFSALQRVLPTRALSMLMYRLTRIDNIDGHITCQQLTDDFCFLAIVLITA